MKWPEKRVIRGCEGRGDSDSVYLVRYVLLEVSMLRVYLHVFHRSDMDDLHDHPWPFVTCVLWRGYMEQAECTWQEFKDACGYGMARWFGNNRFSRIRRVWPGMILFRPARWTHRVQLLADEHGVPKKAVTLVFVGPKQKSWSFFTKLGAVPWREYYAKLGCR